MSQIQGLPGLAPTQPLSRDSVSKVAEGFQNLLNEKLGVKAPPAETSGLRFSNHAVERMKSRGIGLDHEQLSRLEQAVEKAQSKGSRETLVLAGDSAFIVNIKNKMVVTAMDRQQMKENVFTNIDSTIVL